MVRQGAFLGQFSCYARTAEHEEQPATAACQTTPLTGLRRSATHSTCSLTAPTPPERPVWYNVYSRKTLERTEALNVDVISARVTFSGLFAWTILARCCRSQSLPHAAFPSCPLKPLQDQFIYCYPMINFWNATENYWGNGCLF